MIVYSSEKPSAYFYHVQPGNHKKTLIRFCENARQRTKEVFGESATQWAYDEYTIEVETRENMDGYIKNHLKELRAEAIGGASIIEQLCAKMDYLSMMSGIDIPGESEIMTLESDGHSKNFKKVSDYAKESLWNAGMIANAVGKWITEEEYAEIVGST